LLARILFAGCGTPGRQSNSWIFPRPVTGRHIRKRVKSVFLRNIADMLPPPYISGLIEQPREIYEQKTRRTEVWCGGLTAVQ